MATKGTLEGLAGVSMDQVWYLHFRQIFTSMFILLDYYRIEATLITKYIHISTSMSTLRGYHRVKNYIDHQIYTHYNTLPVRSVSDIFGNKAWGEILNQNIVLTCKLSLIQKFNIKTWIPIARRTIIHLLIETCLKISRKNLRWNSESEGRLELTNLTLIQKLRKIGCIRSLCSFHALPDLFSRCVHASLATFLSLWR